MTDDSTTECLLFPGIFRKPTVAQFDQREGSSDGGALLLKAADRHYDLVAGLSSCLRDERQAGKVDHSLRELVAQRVFSIACGYPDANDSARLSVDPIHKLLLDRDPIEGRDLASQPTLSRFENGVGVKELYRSGEFLAESVIRRHAKRLHRRATDELQGFIAAWSALEIFINGTFKATYEVRWFEIMEDGAPASAKPVFERLK